MCSTNTIRLQKKAVDVVTAAGAAAAALQRRSVALRNFRRRRHRDRPGSCPLSSMVYGLSICLKAFPNLVVTFRVVKKVTTRLL